jgi:hypothetical protein
MNEIAKAFQPPRGTMEPIIFAEEPSVLYIIVPINDALLQVPDRKRAHITALKELARKRNLDRIVIAFEDWCRLLG